MRGCFFRTKAGGCPDTRGLLWARFSLTMEGSGDIMAKKGRSGVSESLAKKGVGKRGVVGFEGKGDKGSDAPDPQMLKKGYRVITTNLDPHDLERNPRGGLVEGTNASDVVDRDHDRDGD